MFLRIRVDVSLSNQKRNLLLPYFIASGDGLCSYPYIGSFSRKATDDEDP